MNIFNIFSPIFKAKLAVNSLLSEFNDAFFITYVVG